jgi:hypothetical protein
MKPEADRLKLFFAFSSVNITFNEIVYNAENFSNFIRGKYAHVFFVILLIFKYKDNKNQAYLPLFLSFLSRTQVITNRRAGKPRACSVGTMSGYATN